MAPSGLKHVAMFS